MREPIKVVAIIAANPALSSILGMMLAADPGLRVRQFESQTGLETYMRLAPVDLVVADFDCEAAPADILAEALHANEALVSQDFEIIALTHKVTAETKVAALHSGIGEVIVKPMSPRYLLDRVLSRLRRSEIAHVRPSLPRRRIVAMPTMRSDNVVQLFPA